MKSPRLPMRRIVRWMAVLALAVGSLGVALSDGGDLLVGLAIWSLFAVPLVAAGIYAAKHNWDIGRFFAGGDPYEGHGPD